MRPLELKLRNFRSYFGDDYVFDFRDRRLVGIVGPIGSGKSTLLDAIAFALYGRTPAVGRGVKSLIHQRADAAAVSLRFEVDGTVWEAVRSLRRKGASQHALYRLDSDRDDADQVEKIMLEGDVNPRIEQLLGLDFDAFGRSVLLAQGQFDEFLGAAPAERDRVLKGVFGYERIDLMQTLAKEHVAAVKLEAAELAGRLQQVEQAETRLADTKEELEVARQRRLELDKAAAEVEELEAGIEKARAGATAATEQVTRLRALEERLPDAAAVANAMEQAGAASAARLALAEQLAESQRHLDAAAAANAELTATGEEETLQRAGDLLGSLQPQRDAAAGARRRLDAADQAVAAAKRHADEAAERTETAREQAASAVSTSETAKAAADAATEALHEARHADMASSLRTELVEGEMCPVCRQTVATLPDPGGAVDLEAARSRAAEQVATAAKAGEAATAAQSAAAAAETALSAARKALDQAQSTREAEAKALAAAEQALAARLEELTELLGSGEPDKLLAARRSRLRETAGAVDQARRQRDDVSEQHRRAVEAETEAGAALGELRMQVVDLAGRLDEAIDPGDTADALGDAVDVLRRRWSERVGEQETAVAAAKAAEQTARTALTDRLAELGVEESFSSSLGGIKARIELLERAVAADEETIANAATIVEKRDVLAARLEVFERLASDLTNSRFIRYLLDEERARLADLGSEHFERLTSGRYRFTPGFDVVDLTAADAVRKADSLSGGETFLASLGLALALAEMVTRGGGRLDAFFLDEGFGTLDPEHLDLAMDGIESLVTDGTDRLVVVVSHVPELRTRIEDKIELDRNPVTGDTIVRHS